MTIEKIRKLHGGLSPLLPKGAVKKIAEKLHRDHSVVSLILGGKWWDKTVVDAAIEEIETDIKAKQEILDELKS